jgi:hypothetical protein
MLQMREIAIARRDPNTFYCYWAYWPVNITTKDGQWPYGIFYLEKIYKKFDNENQPENKRILRNFANFEVK